MVSCDFSTGLHQEILDAQNYIDSLQYDKATQLYSKILKRNISNVIRIKILYRLGEINTFNLNNATAGIKHYEDIKKYTDDPIWLVRVQERMGEINFTILKNYETAVKNYFNLTSFRPVLKKNDFYQYRLGLSYLKLKQYQNARSIFKSISSNREHDHYLISPYYLGISYFEEKKWTSSIKYWKKYLVIEKRKDKIAQTKFLMANAYETMEKLKEAYDIYYSILGDYPNFDVIKNRLEALYARRVARKR